MTNSNWLWWRFGRQSRLPWPRLLGSYSLRWWSMCSSVRWQPKQSGWFDAGAIAPLPTAETSATKPTRKTVPHPLYGSWISSCFNLHFPTSFHRPQSISAVAVAARQRPSCCWPKRPSAPMACLAASLPMSRLHAPPFPEWPALACRRERGSSARNVSSPCESNSKRAVPQF